MSSPQPSRRPARRPSRSPSRRPSRRTVLGTALTAGTVIGLGVTGTAAATTAAPRVYTRAEWEARPPTQPVTILDHPPDRLVVHHTASDNTPDLSLEQAFRLSHWIQDLHMDQNGWIDAGQQLTISRGGYVLEGRDRSLEAIEANLLVYGTHVGGENDHTLGIENEGLYTAEDPPAQQIDALVETLAWLCGVHGLDPYDSIVGHRDYNDTQCPGDVLYGRLPEIRDRVAQSLG